MSEQCSFVTRSRVVLTLLIMLAPPSLLIGRLIQPWTYKEMFDKADLVAIAYVVSTKDTGERTTVLDDVKVAVVLTEFKIALILKGPQNISTFQLHHYRFQSEHDRENIANAPALVQIGPYHPVFLLFLVKESGGTYAPVTGQIDPAMFSVLRLNGSALGDFEGPPLPR